MSVLAIGVVVGGSALFLLGAAGGHPLAEKQLTDGSLCGALMAGPAGGIQARSANERSPLALMRGTLPICDIDTASGPISVAATTRLALRNTGDGDDTASEAAAREAEGLRTGQQHQPVDGPWRKAWMYRPADDPRTHLQVEDNGVLLLFVGQVDDQSMVDAARRAAEALRAAVP